MTGEVLVHPEALAELSKLPAREKAAMDTAMEKLRAVGPNLGFPHTGNVQSAEDIRELRPRQGRSPWRAFYRVVDGELIVAAIGPEASVDGRALREQLGPPHLALTNWRRTDEALRTEVT